MTRSVAQAPRYWIGVASLDHIKRGVQGGFCQLSHGKHAPVKRLSPGDWIVYYAPRTEMRGGEAVQAFASIGKVKAGEAYVADAGEGFKPLRRDVRYVKAKVAPIRPLIGELSFIADKKHWGYAFRSGVLEIPGKDFRLIARAMDVDVD